ncbi:hypothetical protein E0Z10_g4343 [Xylaria hypoxylon]|uniref:Uncharacterized protein n=1 Tax=Xylaria hypoxylon TaxID=37992 RepID=A0A4Z0YY56_9PEZI|nr:hypothetical protein E0Z10_g4343 [Xylaria hypoxylon]
MVTKVADPDNQVQIRLPIRTKSPLISVHLKGDAMQFEYGGIKDALTLSFMRTIRVPDNRRDINSLPPSLGRFQPMLVQVGISITYSSISATTDVLESITCDYAKQVPIEVAEKSGIFFTMYQREAMWIDFKARLPFAIRIFVGGINAVSGFPMKLGEEELRKQAAKRERGESIQDYMVVPGQRWLDGIVCNDGEIRQFVAQPKGSGFSVEAQITGKDTIRGIQVEIIPIRCEFPKKMEVRYKDHQHREISRKIDLVAEGLGLSSTWKDLKTTLAREFDIPVGKQVLYPRVAWNHYLPISDDLEISKYYFKPDFVLGLSYDPRDAVPPRSVAGGMADYETAGTPSSITIKQTIEPDRNPADSWNKSAAIQFHVHILDTATFAAVTGQPVREPPISARTYAEHDSPFFSIWGEEPTGIKGSFDNVKSIAELEEARAKAEGTQYVEEESLAFIVRT